MQWLKDLEYDRYGPDVDDDDFYDDEDNYEEDYDYEDDWDDEYLDLI